LFEKYTLFLAGNPAIEIENKLTRIPNGLLDKKGLGSAVCH
jgi:hypothetical protein